MVCRSMCMLVTPCITSVLCLVGTTCITHSDVVTCTIVMGCFLQILECVAINLTLIYAMLAYSSIKQRDFSTVYVSQDHAPAHPHIHDVYPQCWG